MSAFSGPEISTSGLIFCYDANNTEKSWKGKPTTNNAANGKVDYYSRWGTTTTHPPLPFDKKTDVYELTNGNNYFGGSAEYSITNGNTYTVSYWYYISTTEVMQHYMLPLTGAYALAATVNATNFVDTNNTNNVSGNINGWVWGYKTFTVTTAPTYMRGTYTTGGGDSTPTGKMYITNVMIEPGSTPSGPYGYTGSTRSNTQAILDLTNNNTITVQNLSYSSGGSFSFDGTDDFLTGSELGQLTQFTAETWFKPTSYPNNSACTISSVYPGSNSTVNFKIGYEGGSAMYGGFYDTTWRLTPAASTTLNVWHQIVFTYNGASLVIYKNGEFVGSTSYSGTPNSGGSGFRIGRRWDITDYFVGNIDVAKVYNRALSTQEVAQNFQALRGRYGV